MKNIDQAFQWIESFTNFEKYRKGLTREYRVERMMLLLEHFGHPERDFKSIHVAGSKGKGSTCALMAGALASQGFKTGLYSSPHVLHYRERFLVNGQSPADEVFISIIENIKKNLPSGLPGGDFAQEPTTFELLTLTAFLLFREEHCQWALIETGLGGRLDATNVLLPQAVVLTPVELEHTAWLGESLSAIAGEKAGIMKKGIPVFSAPQEQEVLKVFRKKAGEKHCPFSLLSHKVKETEASLSIRGTDYVLHYRDGRRLEGCLSLCGKEQVWNMALALEVLGGLFPSRPVKDWLPGMEKTRLSARMEILNLSPLWICDGAHTPRSTTLALNSFLEICKTRNIEKKHLLFACQDDKDSENMAKILAPHFKTITITSPGYFKESHPKKVQKHFTKAGVEALLDEKTSSAFDRVRENCGKEDALLILGSFFLAGEIKAILNSSQT